MDPATPLQPYTPPSDASQASVSGMSGMAAVPAPPPMPSSPQVGTPMPPIVPGQPYLSTSTPPLAPPVSPAVPTFDNSGVPMTPLPPDAGMPVAPPVGVDVKSEVVESLRKANNVLVTVSSNPTVDQLAAAIGITLVLNKLDKHATAVYSGETPSVLEFLQPEKTIEKNTDSLRDFIIALDKAKADKLRYKVEDKFVKIFITPYHTSLTESDLEFSQGDFNVDVILALGVHQREELDQSITAHGRILHDAVTISINNKQPSDLGAINWFQAEASSLAEMLVSLVEPLQGDKILLDEQIATSFLTGVVAETERFSNNKTTPFTMNISATLMKAGANQQLVSSKLEAPQPVPEAKAEQPTPAANGTIPVPSASNDGSLAIEHDKEKEKEENKPTKTLQDLEKENNSHGDEEGDSDLAKIHIDEQGELVPADKPAPPASPSNMILQPPTMGGAMTATTKSEDAIQPSVDAPPADQTAMQHAKTISPLTEEEKTQTLSEIEKSVDSSHITVTDSQMPTAEQARQAIEQASASVAASRLEPISALNAQPIDLVTPTEAPAPTPAPAPEPTPPAPVPTPVSTPTPLPAGQDLTTEDVFPTQLVGPDKGLPPDPTAAPSDPTAPPTVPPPFMPNL